MNAIFLINSILLGFGLAMDAFSVSLANGLNEPKMNRRRMSVIAGVYAGFQIAMPLIGWICVHTIANVFQKFQVLIPWIALILLLYIGGSMLIEGIRSRKNTESAEEGSKTLTMKVLMVQGIATSIDALSVGFTIAEYDALMALTASLLIGIVTFVVCVCGLAIGKKAGTRLAWRASILGGVILIGIGIEIFVRGMFGI